MVCVRTICLAVVLRAIEGNYDETFDAKEWLADEKNIAIQSGDDINLFEYIDNGVYEGHFFYVSRGRDALNTATEVLDYFLDNYDVQVIRGLTPLHKKGARWLARKIGFKSYGEVETAHGPCELFILKAKQ